MTDERHDESLMEASGLGLLPGITIALGLIVLAMGALLSGSMWAVVGVLALIGVCVAAILLVVIALMTEGEAGERMRARIPGLASRTVRHD